MASSLYRAWVAQRRRWRGRSSTRSARVASMAQPRSRSEEHTSELQSLRHLVCRLLLEKKEHTFELQSLRHLVSRLLIEDKKIVATEAEVINDEGPHDTDVIEPKSQSVTYQ